MTHRSIRKRWPSKLRVLVETAESRGCVAHVSKHFGLFYKGRRIFTMPMTASDKRAFLNAASTLRKVLREIQA